MSVSYNLVQIVKETFGVDEVKAKAFAEAVAAEHASQTATKEDLRGIEKNLAEMNLRIEKGFADSNAQMIELVNNNKWMVRGISFTCAILAGGALKYFFHF